MAKKMHLLFSRSLRQTGSVTRHFFLLELVFFSIFFVLCTMGRASQISLVDRVLVVSNEAASKQRASDVCCGTEKDRPQSLEKDLAILPQISLRKYAEANEGRH